MNNIFTILAISLLVCTLTISEAISKSCNLSSIEQAYDSSKMVFSGTVNKVVNLEPDSKVSKMGVKCGNKVATFSIENIWKGDRQKEIEVYSDDGCFLLGPYFEKGKKYLVYAHYKKGVYEASVCTRTQEFTYQNIESDLEFLDEPKHVVDNEYFCEAGENLLHSQLKKESYSCQTDSDCIFIDPRCPFGCGSAISKKSEPYIKSDLNTLTNSSCIRCVYDCMATSEIAICNEKKKCMVKPLILKLEHE